MYPVVCLCATVFPSGPIQQFDLARPGMDRNQGWNVVDDRVKLPSARLRRGFRLRSALFRAELVLDVGVGSAPPGQSARVIVQRRG